MNDPMVKNMQKFVRIANTMNTIIRNLKISWESKYDMVFTSETCWANQLRKTGITFDWFDLDTSYQEDVTRFNNAVQLKADEFREYFVEASMNID